VLDTFLTPDVAEDDPWTTSAGAQQVIIRLSGDSCATAFVKGEDMVTAKINAKSQQDDILQFLRELNPDATVIAQIQAVLDAIFVQVTDASILSALANDHRPCCMHGFEFFDWHVTMIGFFVDDQDTPIKVDVSNNAGDWNSQEYTSQEFEKRAFPFEIQKMDAFV
jgi:hypothetical protein